MLQLHKHLDDNDEYVFAFPYPLHIVYLPFSSLKEKEKKRNRGKYIHYSISLRYPILSYFPLSTIKHPLPFDAIFRLIFLPAGTKRRFFLFIARNVLINHICIYVHRSYIIEKSLTFPPFFLKNIYIYIYIYIPFHIL